MEWTERSTYVFLRTENGKTEEVWKKLQTMNNTIGTWVVTGEWDIVAWFDVTSWDDTYKLVSELREWDGVTQTSSHFVHHGTKNGDWWWDKPAGTWVMMREPTLNGNTDTLKNKHWITSMTSVPGPWDYMLWVSGNNWNEVWDNVWTLNTDGWQTQTNVPVRSWWNTDWKERWWQATT